MTGSYPIVSPPPSYLAICLYYTKRDSNNVHWTENASVRVLISLQTKAHYKNWVVFFVRLERISSISIHFKEERWFGTRMFYKTNSTCVSRHHGVSLFLHFRIAAKVNDKYWLHLFSNRSSLQPFGVNHGLHFVIFRRLVVWSVQAILQLRCQFVCMEESK